MDLRKIIGEVSGKDIIDKGDKVKIVFFENNQREEIEGILINIDNVNVKINGTTPIREILIENILEIEKC